MSYRRTRLPQTPFVIAVEIAGLGWVMVSLLIANSLVTAVLVILGIALAMRVFISFERSRWLAGGSVMDTMVGGTLGGFLGGITTALVGVHGAQTGMALMTASMAGMVGGVFGGR